MSAVTSIFNPGVPNRRYIVHQAIDVEIGLQSWPGAEFAVDLRYTLPNQGNDPPRQPPVAVQFPMDRFDDLKHDNEEYGRLLSDILFARVGDKFEAARQAAEKEGLPLRVRLVINPSADRLHDLRWELLRDPRDDTPLLTSERIFFSRYIISTDYRPLLPLEHDELRSVMVIASPQDIERWKPGGRQLAPLDPKEVERAYDALDSTTVVARLISSGLGVVDEWQPPTLDCLLDALGEDCDILYLICHGALVRGEPRLWLEDETGRVQVVSGVELAVRMNELDHPPRLVVLASCQSAGTGAHSSSADEGALAALGPRLAKAGVPAVIAMQGNVTMRTVEKFMPRFFEEIRKDGRIDRAIAIARGATREYHDHYMPVLYMRLRHGTVWYRDEVGKQDEWKHWPALVKSIGNEDCTLILGTGLLENLLAPNQVLAERWAETHRFPMAPHHREDLPQVAQYLAVNQDAMFPRYELKEYMRRLLCERYEDELHDAGIDTSKAGLDDLLHHVRAAKRGRGEVDLHGILASLNVRIYLTTSPSNLLLEALREQGKEPQEGYFDWLNDYDLVDQSIFTHDPGFRPTVEKPLVYHLFGKLDCPKSIVLTEDDYFDYLIQFSSESEKVPALVRRALTDTALLFLGFQLDDWNFRILFRSILRQEGSRRRKFHKHVAVQLNGQHSHITEPEAACHYLEQYFQNADVNIYWGDIEEFLTSLQGKLKNQDAL